MAAILTASTGFSFARADEATSNRLVDEVIAGIEANMSLIQAGTASYLIKAYPRSDPVNGHPWQFRLKAFFDYPDLRFDYVKSREIDGHSQVETNKREIISRGLLIEYDLPLGWGGDPARAPADAHTVIISPISRNPSAAAPWPHPRMQWKWYWLNPPSLAMRLRGLRSRSATPIDARREADGMIKVEFHDDNIAQREEFWLSPMQGYCVLRALVWSDRCAEPTGTQEATATEAGNGSFVLRHRLERNFIPQAGKLVQIRRNEVLLEKIDLSRAPEKSTFEMSGLEPRVGARVLDEVKGHEYRYGVTSVKENAIVPGAAGGPMGLRKWLGAFNTLVGAAVLYWLGARLGCWLRGRHVAFRRGKR